MLLHLALPMTAHCSSRWAFFTSHFLDLIPARHEIAFVFGQMLSPDSVPALLRVLEDGKESDMVRHEAAEALGGIATPEVLPYLRDWMTREDSPQVVRESCQVAIDMWEVSAEICDSA